MNLLSLISPRLALKREQARQQLKLLKRYYDAAQPSNYRKKFRPTSSANETTLQGAKRIRDYARHLDENHDLAIGVLDDLVNHIVGAGIPISPAVKNKNGELAADFNQQIANAFTRWKVRPEASRTLPYDEMTRLVCRAWLRDGESLIQRIKGRSSKIVHYTDIPYSLELLESDVLPIELNTDSPRKIIQGIEVNNWSRPIFYHLLKEQPGIAAARIARVDDTKKVAADNIFHIKFVRRISQMRGISVLHGVITRMDDTKNYEESERIAAQVAASMTGYIKKSPDVQIDPNLKPAEEKEERELQMSPGMIFDNLLPGEEVGTISSDRPNTGLVDFRNAMLKAVAAGTGTSYPFISKNYDLSYSAMRQVVSDNLPGYEKMRNYFIDIFIRPMYIEFLDMALLSRALVVPVGVDINTLYQADIRGVLQPWIDPKKEIEADIMAINNGIRSRDEVIRQRGGDPIEVDKKLSQDDFEPKQTAPAAPEPANSDGDS